MGLTAKADVQQGQEDIRRMRMPGECSGTTTGIDNVSTNKSHHDGRMRQNCGFKLKAVVQLSKQAAIESFCCSRNVQQQIDPWDSQQIEVGKTLPRHGGAGEGECAPSCIFSRAHKGVRAL